MDITQTREWRQAARVAAETCAENRRLVFAYPDIAARLCQPPLNFARPDHWRGYIPPAFMPPNEVGIVKLNDSPNRVALLAILEAAAERADAQDCSIAPARHVPELVATT